MTASLKIAAIVLAAGQSTRMGDQNKLLTQYDDKPLVVHVLDTVTGFGFSQVVVVTGFEAEIVSHTLEKFNVEFVYNQSFTMGLSSSLCVGIASLLPDTDAVIIFLGDMPDITHQVIRKMIAKTVGPQSILVPVYEGKRGNPILWGSDYFAEMASIKGDKGARELLKTHVENVVETRVETPGILNDFDRQSDFEK